MIRIIDKLINNRFMEEIKNIILLRMMVNRNVLDMYRYADKMNELAESIFYRYSELTFCKNPDYLHWLIDIERKKIKEYDFELYNEYNDTVTGKINEYFVRNAFYK